MPKIQKQSKTSPIPPTRTYSDSELQDFHQKIQRFKRVPRTLPTGVVAQKFDHEALHVAYGAARTSPHGKTIVYLYNPERYRQFVSLWDQYQWFMMGKEGRKEAAEHHQLTSYEQIHQESNIQDELF